MLKQWPQKNKRVFFGIGTDQLLVRMEKKMSVTVFYITNKKMLLTRMVIEYLIECREDVSEA